MPITRTTLPTDAHNLIRLLISNFAHHSDADLEKEKYFQKWKANYEVMLGSDLVTSYVAEDDVGKLLGVVTIYLLPRLELAGYYAVAEDVFVAESARGQGIGTQIFEHVIAELKQKDVKSLTLNVDPNNTKAQEFYRRLGFDSITMELRIEFSPENTENRG